MVKKKMSGKKMKGMEIEMNCCGGGCSCSKDWKSRCGGAYFFGFVGAAIYFVSHSVGFWGGVFGIVKAIFWPAFVVFKILGM